jgi:ketosteroid isomerase-like protein
MAAFIMPPTKDSHIFIQKSGLTFVKKRIMKTFLACSLFIFFVSCSTKKPGDKDSHRVEIIRTDSLFSAMSRDKGMKEAFIFFAADEVIKPQNNQQPLVGKDALVRSLENEGKPDFSLTWIPLKADASDSLGYTFGNWMKKAKTVSGADTTFTGNYVSIWKRQSDGSWKYVFDSGNPTPGLSVLH